MAARLKISLVNAPIAQVFMKRHDTNVLDQMQLAGAIKVDNRVERVRVPVKEELIVLERVVVAQRLDLLNAGGEADLAQAGVWYFLECFPHGLVAHSAHIQYDALLVEACAPRLELVALLLLLHGDEASRPAHRLVFEAMLRQRRQAVRIGVGA